MDEKEILVLSGGSLRGIAHIGVLKALEEKNYLKNIKKIVATSAGGLIAAMFVIGYSPSEQEEIFNTLDLKLLKNIKGKKLFDGFGLDTGKKIIVTLEELIKEKNFDVNLTFEELFNHSKIELYLTTVCVNDRKLIYLSHLTHPKMPVIVGIRMSISIPVIFTPYLYENKLYVDGGMMNNFPVNFFKKEKKKIIGVLLNQERNNDETINSLPQFILSVIDCCFEGLSNLLMTGYEKQTINLVISPIGMYNTDLDIECKKNLFQIGYVECMKFILKNEKNKNKNKKNIKNVFDIKE